MCIYNGNSMQIGNETKLILMLDDLITIMGFY